MAYVVPSVLVYQQLASNGGVANVTPDLDACIIGPCNNVVDYSTATAGDLLLSSSKDAAGNQAVLPESGTTNAYMPSAKIGQIVDLSSIKVYLNNAYVQSQTVRIATPTTVQNRTVMLWVSVVVSGSNGSNTVTYSGSGLFVGDNLLIPGGAAGGADLLTTVQFLSNGNSSSAGTATIFPKLGATVSSVSSTRRNFNIVNPNTSTLNIEPGDLVELLDQSSGVSTFTTIKEVVGSAGVYTALSYTDDVPSGWAGGRAIITKKMNNLLLPPVYPKDTQVDDIAYNPDNVNVDGYIRVFSTGYCPYGLVKSGDIHIQYSALRQDISGSVLDINNDNDREAILGTATDKNPLALAVQLALANTVGRIRAIALQSDDLSGYLRALDLSESTRLHSIVPLTQEDSILAAVQQHVEQMSTPEYANWRVALINTKIPDTQYIGQYNPDLVNYNSGGNTISLDNNSYVLYSSNSTFISDGVLPGDEVRITQHAAQSGVSVKSVMVVSVLSNQKLIVQTTQALTVVRFYVLRTLTRVQQAEYVAAVSETFGSKRVMHIQPDKVGVIVQGTTKYLPGYYLCAAYSGLTSGLPAQQGLTNVGIAGIADLQRSNFFFTRAQMSTMAAAGTCLTIQEAQGTIPFSRHSLTTDMTVLQYREIQQVKNIDFLSYFFHDILKGFPGRYNITSDTLQILRTTVNAGGKLLQGKVLPKIGAPLLSFNIKTLKQDENNRDHVILELPVTIPTVLNYIDLYLIV